jgi:hypothetical protein
MPVVRSQREVSQAPIPGVRKSAAETPLSRGAGLEQAKANRAGAIAGVGDVLSRIGVAKYAEIQQQERDKADQIAAISMSNAFAKFDADYFTHEQTGALKRQGKDALGVPEDFEEKFTKAAGAIEATAVTERQKTQYQQLKARYYQSGYTDARRHTFNAMQKYGRDELESKIANAHDAAVIHATDPDRVAMEMSEAIYAIKELGPKLGLGPEAIEKQVGVFQSKTIDGVVTRLFVNGRDREAKAYFDDAKEKGLITDGDLLAKLEAKVQVATTDANGERAAAEIWTKLAPGPNDDTSPISLDKMETAAREKWTDKEGRIDKGSFDATVNALRSRKQGVNDGRRERQDAQDGAIWGSIFKGATLNDLKRTPAFVNAPGDVQHKVGEYFRREAEHREALAASREGRAAARESRAYTAEARKEQQLELDNWSEMWTIANDPEKLRAMSPEALMAKLPELGHAHVGRLLQEQAKIKKDDETYRSVVVDTDMFKEVAAGAGLGYVYQKGPLSKTQKATLGAMLGAVKGEIARQQGKAGRRLDFDETKAITQSVLDAKAMAPGGWASLWQEEAVRYSDIPEADRQGIEAEMKRRGDEWSAQKTIDAYMVIKRRSGK